MDEILKELCSNPSNALWSLIGAFALGWILRGVLVPKGNSDSRQASADTGKRSFAERNMKPGWTHSVKTASLLSSTDGTSTSVEVHEGVLDQATTLQLMELLKKGDKIGAIKLVRAKTGLELLEAKRTVESLQ